MFSDNKKGKGMTDTTSKQNIIAQNTKIVGDVVSEGAYRIDGTIEA